nr:chitooligosaccharidolytic beta-N-acetylglucosaminidase isoform X1 [Leptinotarsa decemlineata]
MAKEQNDVYSTLELCQLMCTNYLNVWPHPTGIVKSWKDLVFIDTRNIVFHFNGTIDSIDFLTELTVYFKDELKREEPIDCDKEVFDMHIYLYSASFDLSLDLETDESYKLNLDFNGDELEVNITAPTVFGLRHGLETLLQLVVPDGYEEKCLATLSNIQISDTPKYKHRGLLLDTARNFLSLDTIKINIDGMAASKMNVLHWHITDSQSFPLMSQRLPNMTEYGAYGPKQIYKPEDIQMLVKYALVRGVRILLEIDGPSHAGVGWQWGSEAGLGDLAVCVNKQPWRSFCIQPPCGQLNPANSNLYRVMNDLFTDIVEMLPNTGMFHMGGDEVFIPCWNSTQEIRDYLKDKPLTTETFYDLWAEHQKKALQSFDSAIGHQHSSIVLWTSQLTQPDVIKKYLPKERYIIQTWVPTKQDALIGDLLKLGYRVIVSTKDAWYLDHGFWGTTQYYNWKKVYENKVYDYSHEAVLGGEVCMWGELVDDSNVQSRTWPRAAAAAERLWTNPRSSAQYAETRFFAHVARLVKRGINAGPVTPLWCVHNQGECKTYL